MDGGGRLVLVGVDGMDLGWSRVHGDGGLSGVNGVELSRSRMHGYGRLDGVNGVNRWTDGDGSWTEGLDGNDGLLDGDGGSNGDGLLDDGGRGRTINDGVESVDGVGGVGNSADGTVRLDQGVLSLHDIPVTGLGVGVVVPGQGVVDGVAKVVLWVGVEGLGLNNLGWKGGDGSSNGHGSGTEGLDLVDGGLGVNGVDCGLNCMHGWRGMVHRSRSSDGSRGVGRSSVSGVSGVSSVTGRGEGQTDQGDNKSQHDE
jgi:hypothetical protein